MKKNYSRHSFDMSEYIFGERFALGGLDLDFSDDLPDTHEKSQLASTPKDPASSSDVQKPTLSLTRQPSQHS